MLFRSPGAASRGLVLRSATGDSRPPGPLRSAGTVGKTELGKNPQGQHHPADMTVTEIATRAPACTSAGALVVPGQRAYGEHPQRLRNAMTRWVPSATRQPWSGMTGEVQATGTARSTEGGSQCRGPFGACVGGSVASRFPRLPAYAAISPDSISVTSSGLQSPVHGFDSRLRLS